MRVKKVAADSSSLRMRKNSTQPFRESKTTIIVVGNYSKRFFESVAFFRTEIRLYSIPATE